MKPVFGIDITENKNNEALNGSEFITNTISKQKATELVSKQEHLNQTLESSKLPLWVRIIKLICGFYALILILVLFRAILEIGFAQAFRNAPLFISGGFACGFIWLFLQFFAKKKENAVLTEQNAERQIEEIDVDIQSIYEELNIPFDARAVDVLLFRYKTKDGQIAPKTVGLQTTPYINVEMKVYATAECLCLADLENVYSFSLSELKSIKTVNKRISVPSWNKEEEPTKGEFKAYKMAVDNIGDVFFKPYYILEGEHNGESFGIYFPCYELAAFEELTGLKAEI